ncbi:hypothetical protein ACLKA7_005029, partial [Drosophila subpalustris]
MMLLCCGQVTWSGCGSMMLLCCGQVTWSGCGSPEGDAFVVLCCGLGDRVACGLCVRDECFDGPAQCRFPPGKRILARRDGADGVTTSWGGLQASWG